MKIENKDLQLFPWLACWALLLAAMQTGMAADSVRLVSLEGRTEAAPRLPAVFGNQTKALNLEIKAAAIPSASLRADLFQVAGSLSQPLAKDVHLQEGVTFPDALPQHLRVSLKFPDVKEHAEVLVRLSLVPPAPAATPVSLGDLRFEVFPASVTKELSDLLKPNPNGTQQPAILFGPGQKLRHFLSGLHVTFEDGGDGTPDQFDPKRRYFGELSKSEQFQQAQDRSAGAHLVLFSTDDSLPEGIYADRSNSGILVQVNSPLLDNLNDDPRAQLALIKIIHLLSASPNSNL